MRGERFAFEVALGCAIIFVLLVVFGCASQPSCYDNPRNMRCMTADQLEKELNQ